jgi:hypothetical protein
LNATADRHAHIQVVLHSSRMYLHKHVSRVLVTNCVVAPSCHFPVATTQQQLMVLVNRPRGVHTDHSALVKKLRPQSHADAASAAQKQQGVRSPLLGKYFSRKMDDSTGDIQVTDAMLCRSVRIDHACSSA